MHLTLIFCYILLTISITPACGHSHIEPQEVSHVKKHIQKRMMKSDAAIIIDNVPSGSMDNANKLIYKRLSKHIYRGPRPMYKPPAQKYVATRKPSHNKFNYKKGYPRSATSPRAHKKRSPKPRYNPSIPMVKHKSVGAKGPKLPKRYKKQQLTQESVGFGEPPSNYHAPNNYAEPPVDSYGAPLETKFMEPYQTTEDFSIKQNYENPEKNLEPDYVWTKLMHPDNNYGYSHKYQSYIKPGLSVFNRGLVEGEQHNLNSYSDVYADSNFRDSPNIRPSLFGDMNKMVNRPWKAGVQPGLKHNNILVGGQYAEPPARYVSKYYHNAPSAIEGGEPLNTDSYWGPEPSTVSPYVNYKNSNMAFSPQNLNDAFSIVDKRRR